MVVEEEGGEGRETNTGLMRVLGAAVEWWMSGGTQQRPLQKSTANKGTSGKNV